MSLKEEISKAIEKNLPAAVAEELGEYLREAESNKSTAQYLRGQVSRLEEKNESLEEELKKHKENSQAQEKLTARERGVEDRERALELEVARIKLEEANKRADIVHALAGTIFRNPVVKRTAVESTHFGSRWDYNQNRNVDSETGKSTEETTTEE